jgi:GNAT superfamily N-acetyltransferase
MVIPATADMSDRICALVHASFNQLVAHDWEPEAGRGFLADTLAPAIASYLENATFAAVELERDDPVGFILMPRPALVSMLFVHPDHLRKGIARRLWEAARSHVETEHSETKTVELNATPYAVAAYRALGFVPISTEFVRQGCRATRMACWLPARALGADAL